MEKIKLSCAVLCEGKYDKIKLSSVIDGVILTTDGFSVFNNSEKKAMIKTLLITVIFQTPISTTLVLLEETFLTGISGVGLQWQAHTLHQTTITIGIVG